MSTEDKNDILLKTEDFDEEEIAECLTCGRTDVDDLNDDTNFEKRSNGGVVYSRGQWEIFICSYCRFIMEWK